MFSEWLNQQKYIILKGFNRQFNPMQDMAIAKQPVRAWKDPNYWISLSDTMTYVEEGFWLGLVIPPGFIVYDIDEDREDFVIQIIKHYRTWVVKTQKGYHLYFKHPSHFPIHQAQNLYHPLGFPVDIREAQKGYVVAPAVADATPFNLPHQIYHASPIDVDELPLCLMPIHKKPKHMTRVPIEQGARHATLLALGHLWYDSLKTALIENDLQHFEQTMYEANQVFCDPPQDINDVKHVIKDVIHYQSGLHYNPVASNKRGEVSETINQIASSIEVVSCDNDVYVKNNETGFYDLMDEKTLLLIAGRMLGAKLKTYTLRELKLKLKYKAFEKPVKLYKRRYEHYINLGSIVFDAKNPSFIPPPVPMVSFPDAYPYPADFRVEDVGDRPYEHYLSFLPLHYRFLIWTWIVAHFLEIHVPSLLLHGQAGAGKTTIAKLIQFIASRQYNQFFFNPNRIDDLAVLSINHTPIIVDNITHIKQEISDILCELITGTVYSKRTLYTDLDMQKKKIKVSFIFTSLTPELPDDLTSRCLYIKTTLPDNPKTEDELFSHVEAHMKDIVGYILQDIADYLAHPDYKLTHALHRFIHWEHLASFLAEKYNEDLADILKQNKYHRTLLSILADEYLIDLIYVLAQEVLTRMNDVVQVRVGTKPDTHIHITQKAFLRKLTNSPLLSFLDIDMPEMKGRSDGTVVAKFCFRDQASKNRLLELYTSLRGAYEPQLSQGV